MELLRVLAAGAALLVSFADVASAQITFRRGTIASVSTAANAIVVYDQQGTVQNALQAPTFNQPLDIAFGPDGSVFVVSLGDNVVYRLNLDGQFTGTITHEQCPNPRGVAVGPEGDIYISNFTNGVVPSSVCRFSSDGSFETALATTDLNSPRGLAFRANGHCYVCDYTGGFIREFDSGWGLVGLYTNPSVSIWPTSIVFGPNGSFHVASRFPSSLYTFTPGSLASGMSLGSDTVWGLTMNANGELLVSRETSGSIGIFSSGVEVNTIYSPVGAPPSGSLAIAPHRFTARLKGRVDTPFVSAQKINEVVEIAIHPGTGRVTVSFTDTPSTVDFSSTIGVPFIVADGNFGTPYYGETKRYVSANEIYETSTGLLTTASIGGEVTGNWATGFFSPTKAKLSLQWSRGDSVFAGTITTIQLLP